MKTEKRILPILFAFLAAFTLLIAGVSCSVLGFGPSLEGTWTYDGTEYTLSETALSFSLFDYIVIEHDNFHSKSGSFIVKYDESSYYKIIWENLSDTSVIIYYPEKTSTTVSEARLFEKADADVTGVWRR